MKKKSGSGSGMAMDKGRLFTGCCILLMAVAMTFLTWEVRQSRLAITRAVDEMRDAGRAAAEKARTMAAGIDKVQDTADKAKSAAERARELWREAK